MRPRWLWVYCSDYLCGHSRAVALTSWAIRWSVENPGPLIQQNFKCVICERKGATYKLANVQNDGLSYDDFPGDRQVNIGGRRLTPEGWEAHRERCAKIYESKSSVWGKYWA